MTQLDRKILQVAVTLLFCATGCAGWKDYTQHLAHKHQAHKAWQTTLASAYNGPCPMDYKEGWKAGYYDVARGESGCVPAVPPQKYWDCRYQRPEGQLCVCAWFDGYRDGVQAARAMGAWYCRTIPSSPTAVLPDRMACMTSPTYYSTWGDAETTPSLPPTREGELIEGWEVPQPAEPDSAEIPPAPPAVPAEEFIPPVELDTPELLEEAPQGDGAGVRTVPGAPEHGFVADHGDSAPARPAAPSPPLAKPSSSPMSPPLVASAPAERVAPTIPPVVAAPSIATREPENLPETLPVALPPVDDAPFQAALGGDEPEALPVLPVEPAGEIVAAVPAIGGTSATNSASASAEPPAMAVAPAPAAAVAETTAPWGAEAAEPANPAQQGLWTMTDCESPLPLPLPVLERLKTTGDASLPAAPPSLDASGSTVVRFISTFEAPFQSPVACPPLAPTPPTGASLAIVGQETLAPTSDLEERGASEMSVAAGEVQTKRGADAPAEGKRPPLVRIAEGQTELLIR